MKPHFISELKEFCCVPYIEDGKWDGEHWLTLTKLIVRLEDGSLVTVPSGFKTNFGSLPRVTKSVLSRMGNSLRGYVFHDWSYSKNTTLNLKQRECDAILYTLSREDGEGYFSAKAINYGLACGGWTAYKKSSPRVKKVDRRVVEEIAVSNGYKLAI
ncbi:hypothetical protein CL634_06985 [bacterium]|nr:hypothetical protein [bacterium]